MVEKTNLRGDLQPSRPACERRMAGCSSDDASSSSVCEVEAEAKIPHAFARFFFGEVLIDAATQTDAESIFVPSCGFGADAGAGLLADGIIVLSAGFTLDVTNELPAGAALDDTNEIMRERRNLCWLRPRLHPG